MRQYICKAAWMQWDESENRNVAMTAQRIIWANSSNEARMNFAQKLVDEMDKPENPWKLDFYNKAVSTPLFR